MALNADKYKLFTNADFQNIIGRNLEEILENEGSGNNSDYFITYVSNLINNYIKSRSGRSIFKKYNSNSPEDYEAIWGYSENAGFTLNQRQLEALQLACIYQADYIIDNGSSERMSGLSMSGRSGIIAKQQMAEYDICSMSQQLLANSGLLYAGLRGGDIYVRFK